MDMKVSVSLSVRETRKGGSKTRGQGLRDPLRTHSFRNMKTTRWLEGKAQRNSLLHSLLEVLLSSVQLFFEELYLAHEAVRGLSAVLAFK